MKKRTKITIFLIATTAILVGYFGIKQYRADSVVADAIGLQPIGSTDGSAWGKLTDPAGQPLANMMVIVSGRTAITDKFGNYELNHIKPGYYEISFFKGDKSYCAKNKGFNGKVSIRGNGSPSNNFTLVPYTKIDTGIASPANGAWVKSTVRVEVAASNTENNITKVEFLLDNNLVSTKTTGPWTFDLDTSKSSMGEHVIRSKAFDVYDNFNSSLGITIKIDNILPTSKIELPPNNENASDSLYIKATANDNIELKEVNAYIGSTKIPLTYHAPFLGIGTPYYETTANVWSYPRGKNTLKVIATDQAGNTSVEIDGTNKININLITKIQTSITKPIANALVSGTVSVEAQAEAKTSSTNANITKVELMVDNNTVANKTTAPWTYNLDTKTLSNGDHALKVKAYDEFGSSNTSAEVKIKVDNSAPTAQIAQPPVNENVSDWLYIKAYANDNNGIKEVNAYLDNAKIPLAYHAPFLGIGSPYYETTVDIWQYPRGQHTLKVIATDQAGNTSVETFGVNRININFVTYESL